MSQTTLFVLPLDQKYICPVHKGILVDPVIDNHVEHSICRVCSKQNDVVPNVSLQEEIDSLLCYCKYGVTRNEKGDLMPNNKGCSHIVKYASRLQHEAVCAFNDKDFIMVGDSLVQSNVQPTSTSSESKDVSVLELQSLLAQRDARIAALEQEVVTLRAQLQETEHPASAFAKRTADGTKELMEDLMKVIAQDIPNTIHAAHTSLVQSEGYQKSTEALSSLKDKVAAKAQYVGQQAAEIHPLDKLISALVELRDELMQNVKQAMSNRASSTPEGTSEANNSTDNGEDNDLQASLQRSMASFEEEEKTRIDLLRAEQAALAAATVASLREEQ